MIKKKSIGKRNGIRLITCGAAAIACFAAGAIALNYSRENHLSANADEAISFYMSAAAMRANSAQDPSEQGLRFTAYIDKANYEAIVSEGSAVEAGTFIMPYDYIAKYGDITESSCFVDHVYTWEAKAETSGKTILHCPAMPYETTVNGGEAVYRINASVVDMKDKNLDREYVAKSYIKITVNGAEKYYFAKREENFAKDSVANLAQGILLSETASEAEKSVATDFVQSYIDRAGGAELKLATEYYVNSSAGRTDNGTVKIADGTGYSKSESLSKTETITLGSVEDFTKLYGEENPGLAGYKFVKGSPLSSAATRLKACGTATLKYYFDKDYGSNDFLSVSEMKDNLDIIQPSGVSDGIKVSNSWGWNGGESLRLSWHGTADWGKIQFKNTVHLEAPTDTFSFMVKHENPQNINDFAIGFLIKNQETGAYSMAAADTYNIATSDTTELEKIDTEAVYKVTFKINKKISAFDAIEFLPTLGKYDPILIDRFRAEIPVGVKGGNVELNAENALAPVEINVNERLFTTVYSVDEFGSNIAVSYKKLPNGTVIPATIENGKFTIAPEKESNYEVSLGVTIGGETVQSKFYVLGYFKNMITSFEEGEGGTASGDGGLTDNCIDGTTAFRAVTNTTNWAVYKWSTVSEVTDFEKTLCLWIYTDVAKELTVPNMFYYYLTSGAGYFSPVAVTVSLEAGWNYCEFAFTSDTDFTAAGFKGLEILTLSNGQFLGFTYDRISLKSK